MNFSGSLYVCIGTPLFTIMVTLLRLEKYNADGAYESFSLNNVYVLLLMDLAFDSLLYKFTSLIMILHYFI